MIKHRYGKLALERAWQRVITTMALVLSLCVALVTMLRFLSDNSLVHAIVTSLLLAIVAYVPSLILQHDKSDFSNSKLRVSLISYLRSLPQMQQDTFPIGELLKDVQMDKSALMESGILMTQSPTGSPLMSSPTSIDEEALLAASPHTNYRSVV